MHARFDLAEPTTLNEALELMADDDGRKTMPLAGGTNLIVDLRSGRERPERVVALAAIDELRGLEYDGGRITVGAGTTVSDLLAAPEIAEAAPSLIDAARVFAGQMVRNAATLAGNIACGSPAADLVMALMSLDGEVVLESGSGTRTVALDDYYLGYKQDVRRPDELITKISWSRPPENSVNTFYKLARRAGDAITITGVAATLAVSDGVCSKARIVLGAVSSVVLRAKAAEALLEGKPLTPALIDAAAGEAAAGCRPIDDLRASAEYRRHTAQVLTRRMVGAAWHELV